MKLIISIMLLFSSLMVSAKAVYLFDGKNLKNVISDDFQQNGAHLEGLGNLTLVTSAPAVQVDFMIKAVHDTEITIDAQSAYKLQASETSQRFTFTYRRLIGEQKSIRIAGQEIIYFGNQARFSPQYFNGELQNQTQKSSPVQIHFNQTIKKSMAYIKLI